MGSVRKPGYLSKRSLGLNPSGRHSLAKQRRLFMNKDAHKDARDRRKAPLSTPGNLGENAVRDISAVLAALLADMFALYLKTKNFHWHVSGPHFRDYHLMLDEQAAEIFATTDEIAERARKLGGTTIRSIGHIAKLQRVADNDADFVTP